MNIVIETMKV